MAGTARSVVEAKVARGAERVRDGRRRWAEGGFSALRARERWVTVVALLLVAVLVAAVLVATVQSITAPGRSDAEGGAAAAQGDEVPAVAAAVALARLVDSDRAQRVDAYFDVVDPEIIEEAQGSFEPGVAAVLEQAGVGSGGELATLPQGYRITLNDGRVVGVELLVQQDVSDARGEVMTTYLVSDVLMRWNGRAWLLFAFLGSTPGPAPGDAAADRFTDLPEIAAP